MRDSVSKLVFILGICILLFAVSGCRPFKAEIPSAFAVSRERGNILIYSHDGFKMGIKTERNRPRRDTLFWAGALKTALKNRGYFLIDEAPFSSVNLEGKKMIWLMPLNHTYYKYMTAVAVRGRKIYIIEASGERGVFDSYEEDIAGIISSLSARR
ncbi:MAG: hypothetical protein FWC36_01145 [Spirochaetes bacterium]|nr:hypothetical protein [Spirochaetota bacterium]